MAKSIASINSSCRFSKGVFVDANNNVYVPVIDAGDFVMYKAGTDPMVDTWTEQDSAGAFAQNFSDDEARTADQYSDVIAVGGWDATDEEYVFHEFGTSDHASADQWLSDTLIEHPANAPIDPRCCLIYRTDGDFVFIYTGDTDKIMGTDYDRTDYYRSDTSSAGNNLAGDGVEESFEINQGGRAESDRMLAGVYEPGVDWSVYDLSSTYTVGSLDAQGWLLQGAADPNECSNILVYYDDAGTDVIMGVGVAGTTVSYSRTMRNLTAQTLLALATPAGSWEFTIDTDVSIVVDSAKKVYCIYAANDGFDDALRYQTNDDEAGWTDDAEYFSNTNALSGARLNIIDHGGGDVLASVFYDSTGTTLYYHEVSLSSPASRPASASRQIQRFDHLLRR